MRLIAFSSTLILSGSLLVGQQLGQKSTVADQGGVRTARSGSNCPIGMHLSQGASTQMMRSAGGDLRSLMTPVLTITPPDTRTISTATVTVFGFGPRSSRLVPLIAQKVPEGQTPPPEPSRQIKVKFHPDGKGDFAATLWITDFTDLMEVEIDSIRFSDGVTRKLTGCRAVPDPLLLVAAD